MKLQTMDIIECESGRKAVVFQRDDRYFCIFTDSSTYDSVKCLGDEVGFGVAHETPKALYRASSAESSACELFRHGAREFVERAAEKHHYKPAWQSSSVKLGTYTATIKDGKFEVAGITGTSEDAAKWLEVMDSTLVKPGDLIYHENCKAYLVLNDDLDVAECQTRSLPWLFTLSVISIAYQQGRFMKRKQTCSWSARFLDGAACIYRPKNPLDVAEWAVGMARSPYQWWDRIEIASYRFGSHRVWRERDNEVRVGCQTITREQLSELIKALEESVVNS